VTALWFSARPIGRIFFALNSFLFLVAAGAGAHAQSASFRVIPDPGGGAASNVVRDVSADGRVATGTYQFGSSGAGAFRWNEATGSTPLGVLPGFAASFGNAVNADGSVVVGSSGQSRSGADGKGAFRWTAATGLVNLGGPSDAARVEAKAVNADGTIVVGDVLSASGLQPFRWSAASGLSPIALPSGTIAATAPGASADGGAIAGTLEYMTNEPLPRRQGYRWMPSTGYVGVGYLPGANNSEAYAISADGNVVVGGSGLDYKTEQAFRWNSAGIVGLGTLDGNSHSTAHAVNTDGSVIVGWSFGPNDFSPRAFRWTAANGMQSIETLLTQAGVDFTGWKLSNASGVSADGTVIVGYGSNPAGLEQGWMARLPSPTSATSVVAAVAPNARTSYLPGGPPVTAFATIINSGSVTATACSIALPASVPASLHYQRTDGQNVPVGAQNAPVDILAGASQTFVFSIAPSETFARDIPLIFDCANTAPAPVVAGLNTLLVSVGSTPIPDLISIADTLTHDAVANIPGASGTGLMVTAAVNIGATGSVTCTPTASPTGQPARNLPASLSICQTGPDGQCVNPPTPGASATVNVPTNQTVFFSTFIRGSGQTITFDPANNRVFFICLQGSTPVGAASIAVRTQ
jgi:probable HAF family extracellular repeat protein